MLLFSPQLIKMNQTANILQLAIWNCSNTEYSIVSHSYILRLFPNSSSIVLRFKIE